MIKKIISITFLSFFLIQCSGNDSSFIEKKVLDPFQSVSLENDERFGKIKLNCVESNLIATDQQTNRIHQLDYNTLNIIKSVGKEGRGPEEFNGIYYADSYDGNLYVSDSGNQGIHVLDENNLKYKSFIPERLSGTRFSVQSGNIYSAAPFADDNSIFQMISLEDYESTHFGESNDLIKGRRNYHHVLANDSQLVAVSLTEPELKIYELDGSLMEAVGLEDEPLLSETLQYANQFYRDPGNSNSAVILFQDATLIGDTLIVNVLNHKQESNSKTTTYNNYIVYKLDEDSFQKTGAFRTNIGRRGVTSSFCVNENHLYSTGGPNQLNIFVFDVGEFISDDN
jgi:hypothetical protein